MKRGESRKAARHSLPETEIRRSDERRSNCILLVSHLNASVPLPCLDSRTRRVNREAPATFVTFAASRCRKGSLVSGTDSFQPVGFHMADYCLRPFVQSLCRIRIPQECGKNLLSDLLDLRSLNNPESDKEQSMSRVSTTMKLARERYQTDSALIFK